MSVSLRCRCPRCGEGGLFSGVLRMRERCEACGLNLSRAEVGDGPAYLVIVLLGFLATGLAVWLELAYSPPYWLQAAIWLPAIPLLGLAMLRLCKAWLIAMQYRYKQDEFEG